MTSFHVERCCNPVNAQAVYARRHAATPARSWSIVHSYLFVHMSWLHDEVKFIEQRTKHGGEKVVFLTTKLAYLWNNAKYGKCCLWSLVGLILGSHIGYTHFLLVSSSVNLDDLELDQHDRQHPLRIILCYTCVYCLRILSITALATCHVLA